LASAPGGSDSIRSASVLGPDFRKSKLGSDDEHPVRMKPHAKKAATRPMMKSPQQRPPPHPARRYAIGRTQSVEPNRSNLMTEITSTEITSA
jgi:hypothetical protein